MVPIEAAVSQGGVDARHLVQLAVSVLLHQFSNTALRRERRLTTEESRNKTNSEECYNCDLHAISLLNSLIDKKNSFY